MKSLLLVVASFVVIAYSALALEPVKIDPLHQVITGTDTTWVGDSDSLTNIKREYNFCLDRMSVAQHAQDKILEGRATADVIVQWNKMWEDTTSDRCSWCYRNYRYYNPRFWPMHDSQELREIRVKVIVQIGRYNDIARMYNARLENLFGMSGIDFTDSKQKPSWAIYSLHPPFATYEIQAQ